MRFKPIETGQRIRRLRESLGLTQIQFAEMFHITRAFCSRIETGSKAPSIDLLVDISEKTGVTLDYLILGKGYAASRIKQEVRALITSLEELERQL